MRTHWLIVVLALTLLGVGLWALFTWRQVELGSRENSNGREGDVMTGLTPAVGEREIVIVVIAARTGSASKVNQAVFDGVHFAADELNRGGGLLGRRVRIIELDNRSLSVGAKEAAQQAVRLRPVAVIGPARSSFALAAARVLQPAGIPMITPVATHPDVTRVGDCIFRICYVDSFQGRLIARFVREELGAKTAICLVDVDRIYSVDLATIFKQSFEAQGGRVIWRGEYLGEAVSHETLVKQATAHKADVIFIPGEARDAGLIVRQLRKAGCDSALIGPDSWSVGLYEFAGDAVEGGYYSTHWHPHLDTPESREFVKRYEGNGGQILRDEVPLSYDALMVVADAIRRAGSTQPAELLQAIQATDYNGVTGPVRFNQHGDPIGRHAVILRLEKGQRTFVRSIAPQSQASTHHE